MIEDKIKEIIIENSELSNISNIKEDIDLRELGIDSINFVKVIVSIEEELEINFNINDLDYNKFPNTKALISLCKKMYSES
ncbi:acyl carrier protein [Halonatronum saccharophilum]|uniref:acyl carrier protein n=1 Tax=Halonatronum saccharophilum TaxID=150060 RepID=UPI000487134B|nr:acyl carrier protein [Halonatronum saccharophilum]